MCPMNDQMNDFVLCVVESNITGVGCLLFTTYNWIQMTDITLNVKFLTAISMPI